MTNDMQHSPADIVSRLLVTLGVASVPGDVLSWPAYVSSEPDRPDEVITVYDTQGTMEGTAHEELQGHYGIQIRVRARTHSSGWARSNLIRQALQNQYQTRVVIDDQTYLVQCAARFASVIPMGRARESARILFSQNLLVMIHNATLVTPADPVYLLDPSGNSLTDPDGNELLEAA